MKAMAKRGQDSRDEFWKDFDRADCLEREKIMQRLGMFEAAKLRRLLSVTSEEDFQRHLNDVIASYFADGIEHGRKNKDEQTLDANKNQK
jgi:hypothetical protein